MNFRDSGYALTYVGLAGIVVVSVLGLEYAPGLKPCTGGGCWGAPRSIQDSLSPCAICLVFILIIQRSFLWLTDVVSKTQRRCVDLLPEWSRPRSNLWIRSNYFRTHLGFCRMGPALGLG